MNIVKYEKNFNQIKFMKINENLSEIIVCLFNKTPVVIK